MGRPRLPAVLKQGKSESKEYLGARALAEEQIKGGEDLVYDYIPDNLDELGVAYYKFIIKELKESGILANLDIPLLTQMADSLAQMDTLQEMIAKDGMLLYKTDRNGMTFPVENSAVNTRMKYQKIFQSISAQFGMSPSARAQITNMSMEVQREAEDPLMKLINKVEKSREANAE